MRLTTFSAYADELTGIIQALEIRKATYLDPASCHPVLAAQIETELADKRKLRERCRIVADRLNRKKGKRHG